MKKLTTLAVTAAFVVVSQTVMIPNAQAFLFGNFNFSDSWGDSWGDGWGSGYSRYDPRWGRYPPPGYAGNRWNNVPPRDRGFSGPRFNFPDRDGFGWGNRYAPRWGALPPPRWGTAPPRWRATPGYYPPAGPSRAPVTGEAQSKAEPK